MRIVEQIIFNGCLILATGGMAAIAADLPEPGSQPDLRVGSTVRVSYVDSIARTGTPGLEGDEFGSFPEATVKGELLEVTGDFISVRSATRAKPAVIPRQCIKKVERKAGGTNKAARALVIGGLGIGLGAVVAAGGESRSGSGFDFGPSEQEVAGATIAAVGVGAAFVSLLFGSDKWEEIPHDSIRGHDIQLSVGNGVCGQTGVFLSGRF